jgi:hypothetical protein
MLEPGLSPSANPAPGTARGDKRGQRDGENVAGASVILMQLALYASLFGSPMAAAFLALRGGASWWSLLLSIARVWALVLVAPLLLLMFIGTQFAGLPREEALAYFGDDMTAAVFIAANVIFWVSVWRG